MNFWSLVVLLVVVIAAYWYLNQNAPIETVIVDTEYCEAYYEKVAQDEFSITYNERVAAAGHGCIE